MKPADIQHLATLSRIRLTDAELATLANELPAIVDYVSVISDIASDHDEAAQVVGVRYNILRPDEVKNEPGEYTADIMQEMPNTSGQFMSVKKILQADE